MKQASSIIKNIIEFVKKIWPSIKIVIKTVAPII